MAQKALREYDGKNILGRLLPDYVPGGLGMLKTRLISNICYESISFKSLYFHH
jgi:hypothetical protein